MQVFHKKQWEMFNKMRDAGELAHAYLLSGPAGVGKLDFAINCAKLLQNIGSQEDYKNHPDIIEFSEPLEISSVRDIKKRVSLSPFSEKYKIIIINSADRMRNESANALLKTIEEPRGDTVFFLIADNAKLLPPTIISRVFEIKFHFVADDLMEKELDTKEILTLKPHWEGRPRLAAKLLEDKNFREKVERYRKDCALFLKGPIKERFTIGDMYAKMDGGTPEALGIWIEYIRVQKDFEGKDNLLLHLVRAYSLILSTNINVKYALNSVAVNNFEY